MKILFVIDNFYPNDNANSNCVTDLAQQLIKRNNEVHILTVKHDRLISNNEIYNGIKIHRMDDKSLISKKNYYKKFDEVNLNIFKKSLDIFSFVFIKCIARLKAKLNNEPEFNMINVTSKHITKLHLDYKYNVVISVSLPLSTSLAVMNAKRNNKNDFKFVIYQLDPFTNNFTLPEKYKMKRYNIERKVLDIADRIVVTDLIYEENKECDFIEFINKMYPLKFPNIKKINYETCKDGIKFDENYINCVFVGALYLDIRNPDYALNLFSKFNDKKIRLNIIGTGAEDMLAKYKIIMGDSLMIYNTVSKSSAFNAMCEADILINIGNNIPNQMPSKIFDYISTGNPIINFYKLKNCPTLMYTKKYPTCLEIDENEKITAINLQKIIDFCCENKYKNIEYEEIKKLYCECTAENVGNKFYDILQDDN
ncbi:hypothetical protein [Clostridium estertheticum]|uniref:hypothetical protein n=1 Tax=Clostridium estertheticum TaxID=238834 RepID=UPI001CF4D039|nr:hypothetical protein [Clostridium estertheticum]MCB2353561.1 hypothetical protein [Clostridium estertheticum]WAG41896.1 hypothetical protein LL065_04080 [Clostridium estertheticum]